MGSVGDHLPLISMVSMQILYAIMALLNRAALLKGMSPTVFIFYRQAIATLVISPVAYFTRKGQDSRSRMGIKSFLWIFITAFIGVVLNQTMYFEGLYLASSSIASATYNLIPALTFLIAACLGMEKLNGKLVSSIAKVVGAILGVGGAICMALLRGPKLLNSQLSVSNSMLLPLIGDDESNTWLLGCLCLFASSCCWSSWLILQVPVTAVYPDHLSLSAWMCFFSTLQAGFIGLVLEPDSVAWNLNSTLELTCIFVSGVFGSGVQFFVQSWCISRRGPFYAAMFTPLATVITTVLACLFLHEQIYTGSLVGAIAVIIGLYVVLWGKSEEIKVKVVDLGSDHSVDKISQERRDEKDLEKSLLANCISHKTEET
ncbi:WAT1-related protein At4g30420-like [Silene latifolia]|uniref:WAT1-related protein At4g30420-like n=1 Tax=Silene latifolia TaxID=37657 RepID=UPI003D77092C